MIDMFGFKRRKATAEQLERAVTLLVRDWDLSDDELIIRARSEGLSENEARRLVALLPSAFVLPTLEAHGVSLHPDVGSEDRSGNHMVALLSNQPEFGAALKLARRQDSERLFDQDKFDRIVAGSAKFDVLRKALEQGIDTVGGVVASVLMASGIADYLVGPLRPFPTAPEGQAGPGSGPG